MRSTFRQRTRSQTNACRSVFTADGRIGLSYFAGQEFLVRLDCAARRAKALPHSAPYRNRFRSHPLNALS